MNKQKFCLTAQCKYPFYYSSWMSQELIPDTSWKDILKFKILNI